eukprot:CAMPEP_0197832690 /NCGR_PEP_ID=MMETSP1437-20131217/15675_1 /TAXON_ID=49252 ORGANISM="Eucampia antarctica, Strain CCMP1452" /NCGR_SAMPLE_ID=MMETSP1437 /ASSEMBLY_ACC=CAM_ASM_001096 /LENGTH=232 /DNA_ID=CAMNT_0043436197 /DNA_START=102 /DNA_END=800 /DNA_ORIENTATION=-
MTQRHKKESVVVGGGKKEEKVVAASAKDQVEKACRTVLETKQRTLDLHHSWRSYLLRVAMLTLLLNMHQMVVPLQHCYADLQHSMTPVVSWESVTLMVGESLYETLSMVVTCALVFFLVSVHRNQPITMTEPSFGLACSLVTVCSFLYYRMRDQAFQCRPLLPEEEADREVHQFPIGLVLHAIVTFCMYFMKMGIHTCDENIELVKTLRATLTKATHQSQKSKAKLQPQKQN